MSNIIPVKDIKNHVFEMMNEKVSLGQDAKNRIFKVVDGYGKREGFWNNIGGIFYRIWNAVKAIFGQSDWQKARNLLQKAMKFEMLQQLQTEQKEELSKECINKCLKPLNRMVKIFANCGLEIAVKSTYIKAKTDEQLQDKLRKLEEIVMAKADKTYSSGMVEVSKILDQQQK